MGLPVFLVAIAAINASAILIYVVSSFGNGMVFHMGWQLCSRLSDGSVCNGVIATASIQITIAAFLLLPIQLRMMIDKVDWKLGIHLSVTQQIGVFVGMYISFVVQSPWLARGLGVSMLVVAIQKIYVEIKHVNDGTNLEAIQKYEFNGNSDYITVWMVGLSSGFFGGLYAAGGPPLMWFVATTNLDKNVCRGTVSFLYLVENCGRILFILLFSPSDEILLLPLPAFLLMCAVLTVTSLGALVTGNAVAARVNQQCFRYLILAMLGFGSMMLTTTNFDARLSVYIVPIFMFICCVLFGFYICQDNTAVGRPSSGSDDETPCEISTGVELTSTSKPTSGSLIESIKYDLIIELSEDEYDG